MKTSLVASGSAARRRPLRQDGTHGIEYGDMQLICEAYQLLRDVAGLNNDEIYEVFAEWNRGELQSYLIEITRDIFSAKDDQPGGSGHLVDKILDVAGAKGTVNG